MYLIFVRIASYTFRDIRGDGHSGTSKLATHSKLLLFGKLLQQDINGFYHVLRFVIDVQFSIT